MNNIVPLRPTQDKVVPPVFFTEDSPLYFKTYERPVYFKGQSESSFYEDKDHKAIVRLGPKGKPIQIGLVGKGYKVLPMKDLCHEAERSFMEAFTQEQLDDCQIKESTSYNGGLLIKQYIFPKVAADIGSSKSNVAFRTIISNGYDGSSSFKLYAGAIDFFCTNGMVTGSYDMIVKRHTSSLTIPKMVDKIKQSIDIFYKQADLWKHWVKKTGITNDEAKACFASMPNVSERRVEQLMRQFHIEALSHGRTVWALYSAATYYATSNRGEFSIRETNNDHAAATILNREQQVRSWLNTSEFQRLAA